MIFSHLARIVAFFALLFGALMLISGLLVAFAGQSIPLQTAQNTGASIDRGIYAILFAIALGTLAEISFSLRKQVQHESQQ